MIYIPCNFSVATAVKTEGQKRTSQPVASDVVPTHNDGRLIVAKPQPEPELTALV